jgi:nicotinamidase-related amidase
MEKNKLLIVVDMQNDFVTGSLANPAAKKIIPNIVEKLKAKDYTYLIFTRDTHNKNYLETQEGKNLPVEHCIEGTNGWEIVPELQEFAKNAFIVDKPTFGYKDWRVKLNELFDDENNQPGDFPEEIELIGVCTGICITSNATILKSLYPEMPISVDSSCCACLNEDTHNAALTVMKTQQIFVK